MTYNQLITGLKAETYKLDTLIFFITRVYNHPLDKTTLIRTTKTSVENILAYHN